MDFFSLFIMGYLFLFLQTPGNFCWMPDTEFHIIWCWISLYFGGSQVVLAVKNLAANEGDLRNMGFIPGLGRSLGEGHGNPLQSSCLENPMDRGPWRATVHKVAKESDMTEVT